MGYTLEFNCLLRIPRKELDSSSLVAGQRYTLTKDGERLYPLNIPIEFCDESYTYYGKAAVRKLTLEANRTILEIEILKLFDAQERDTFTKNFIKP